MTALAAATRRVLLLAIDARRDDPVTAARLHAQLRRFDEPLRVAIAGRVKAGKSTLLNALVGEQVAPTDAGECTRVVTWYRDGAAPRIVLHGRGAAPRVLPVRRRDGALTVDLDGTPAERCERLVVDWPSQRLRTTTLIDTPGMASTSAAVSRRTVDFLGVDPDAEPGAGDASPEGADAVVYLMRHVHARDAAFLEAFRDRGVGRQAGRPTAATHGTGTGPAVNAVAVLSRADEIGGGRVDALFSARAVAARYREDPAVRGLCQDVVAVAGLLAETGRTLRQAEHAALATLARAPRDELERALLSVDRFLRVDGDGGSDPDGPDADVRRRLLDRFGLFGIRFSTSLIRQGARTPATLSDELVARSGLRELEQVLHARFTERRDVLKAWSTLRAVDGLLRAPGRSGPRDAAVAREIEKVLAGAHELTELRLLGALRAGAVTLPRADAARGERLLGDAGTAPAARLDLPADAPPDALRHAAFLALDRWRGHAVNPMVGRSSAEACRAVVRSCEGILAALAPR